jgi:Glycosyltransferase family 87
LDIRQADDTSAAIGHRVASDRRSLPPLRVAIPAVIGAWALVLELPRFVGMVRHDPAVTDFRLFYAAAQVGRIWGWSDIYDPARLHSALLPFGQADSVITADFTYANPPLLALIAAPLTALPLPAAFYIWTAINIAAFATAWLMACPSSGLGRVAILLVSLALWPTIFSIERGQPVLIVYALAIGCWWMAARRREVEAGILLALALAIKPQDVALLPAVLFLCGFRRAAAWWLLTTTALWAGFALLIGPNGLGAYLGAIAWAASGPGYTASPLTAPLGPAASLLAGQILFAALALAGVWRQRRSWRVAFAIGLVGTMVSAVHLHEYDYVGLIVAAWLALGEPTSVIELAWLAIGIVCAQLPAIGIRLPILLWQPVWLAMLALRRASIADLHLRPTIARAPAD